MNAKKNPKLDLEKRKTLFLNLGLLVAGSFTLAAFRYGTASDKNHAYEAVKPNVVDELYEIVPTVRPNTQEQQKPQIEPIFTPDNIKERDKEPDKVIDPQPIDKLPDFVDFHEGPKGMGSVGTEGNPIETLGSEWVEQLPEFPGGDPAMMSFVQSGYKFPRHLDIVEQGTIYVRFTITHKGDVSDVKIERGISPDLDKEALRVVKSMPQWQPGKHRGRPVNVNMIIPIKIRYQ